MPGNGKLLHDLQCYRDTLLTTGSCKPGGCCVVAESGRQIDRRERVRLLSAAIMQPDPFSG